jgi:hypothetical protein
MSISTLDAAIDANANVCLAIVSEKLFFQLDRLFRLKLVQAQIVLTDSSMGDGRVRKFFRTVLQKTQQPVTFTYFLLEGAQRVRIELATLWDVQLDDDGPRSFALASAVGGPAIMTPDRSGLSLSSNT